jgi:hypothetical protein
MHVKGIPHPSFFNNGGQHMAIQTPTPIEPGSAPDITWRGAFSIEQREAMIREAAYYRYMQRGYTPGHELDDWYEAEAEIEHITSEFAEFLPDIEMQQSGAHGARKDDELKRIVRQHPQKAIPQIESVEPENAPFKE